MTKLRHCERKVSLFNSHAVFDSKVEFQPRSLTTELLSSLKKIWKNFAVSKAVSWQMNVVWPYERQRNILSLHPCHFLSCFALLYLCLSFIFVRLHFSFPVFLPFLHFVSVSSYSSVFLYPCWSLLVSSEQDAGSGHVFHQSVQRAAWACIPTLT